jgi:hypothetical protein
MEEDDIIRLVWDAKLVLRVGTMKLVVLGDWTLVLLLVSNVAAVGATAAEDVLILVVVVASSLGSYVVLMIPDAKSRE